jgi:hypothetical protein
MSSKIEVCKTCNGTGIEYDGAGHTCTACNGIAAPIVERQPVEPEAWRCEDYRVDKSATTYDPKTAARWIAKGWAVEPLYTAPPEIAELQATIAHLDSSLFRQSQQIANLTAENERLKGGQGEPRIYEVRIQEVVGDPAESPFFTDFVNKTGADNYTAHHDRVTVTPLFTSQPAPVSAVDEQQAFANWTHQVIAKVKHNGSVQRVQRRDHMSLSEEKVALDAWNARACLDKVKELDR